MMKMIRFFIVFALLLLAGGCASFTSPENEIRITEYGGETSNLPYGDIVVGGVRVIEEGKVKTCVAYAGDKVRAFSSACPDRQNE